MHTDSKIKEALTRARQLCALLEELQQAMDAEKYDYHLKTIDGINAALYNRLTGKIIIDKAERIEALIKRKNLNVFKL
jgi:hypothetical protein